MILRQENNNELFDQAYQLIKNRDKAGVENLFSNSFERVSFFEINGKRYLLNVAGYLAILGDFDSINFLKTLTFRDETLVFGEIASGLVLGDHPLEPFFQKYKDDVLYAYALKGDTKKVEQLIQEEGYDESHAWRGAVAGNHIELIKTTYKNKSHVRKHITRYAMFAALYNHTDLIAWYLQIGIDANVLVSGAGHANNQELVFNLLKNTNAKLEWAVYGAASHNHRELLQTLLLKDNTLESVFLAIKRCVERYNEKLLFELIDHFNAKVKLNKQLLENSKYSQFGNDPLHIAMTIAVAGERKPIIKALAKAGAPIAEALTAAIKSGDISFFIEIYNEDVEQSKEHHTLIIKEILSLVNNCKNEEEAIKILSFIQDDQLLHQIIISAIHESSKYICWHSQNLIEVMRKQNLSYQAARQVLKTNKYPFKFEQLLKFIDNPKLNETSCITGLKLSWEFIGGIDRILPKINMRLTHCAAKHGKIDLLNFFYETCQVPLTCVPDNPGTNLLFVALQLKPEPRKKLLLWLLENDRFKACGAGINANHIQAALGNFSESGNNNPDHLGLVPQDYLISGISYNKELKKKLNLFRIIKTGTLKNYPLLIFLFLENISDELYTCIETSSNLTKLNFNINLTAPDFFGDNKESLASILLRPGNDKAFQKILAAYTGPELDFHGGEPGFIWQLYRKIELKCLRQLADKFSNSKIKLNDRTLHKGKLSSSLAWVILCNPKDEKKFETFELLRKRNPLEEIDLMMSYENSSLLAMLVASKQFRILQNLYETNPNQIIKLNDPLYIKCPSIAAFLISFKQYNLLVKFFAADPNQPINLNEELPDKDTQTLAAKLLQDEQLPLFKLLLKNNTSILELNEGAPSNSNEAGVTVAWWLAYYNEIELLRDLILKQGIEKINFAAKPAKSKSKLEKLTLRELLDKSPTGRQIIELIPTTVNSPTEIASVAPQDKTEDKKSQLQIMIELLPESVQLFIQQCQKDAFNIVEDKFNLKGNNLNLTIEGDTEKLKAIYNLIKSIKKVNIQTLKGGKKSIIEIQTGKNILSNILIQNKHALADIFAKTDKKIDEPSIMAKPTEIAKQESSPTLVKRNLNADQQKEWLHLLEIAFCEIKEIRFTWDAVNLCFNIDLPLQDPLVINVHPPEARLGKTEKYTISQDFFSKEMLSRTLSFLDHCQDQKHIAYDAGQRQIRVFIYETAPILPDEVQLAIYRKLSSEFGKPETQNASPIRVDDTAEQKDIEIKQKTPNVSQALTPDQRIKQLMRTIASEFFNENQQFTFFEIKRQDARLVIFHDAKNSPHFGKFSCYEIFQAIALAFNSIVPAAMLVEEINADKLKLTFKLDEEKLIELEEFQDLLKYVFNYQRHSFEPVSFENKNSKLHIEQKDKETPTSNKKKELKVGTFEILFNAMNALEPNERLNIQFHLTRLAKLEPRNIDHYYIYALHLTRLFRTLGKNNRLFNDWSDIIRHAPDIDNLKSFFAMMEKVISSLNQVCDTIGDVSQKNTLDLLFKAASLNESAKYKLNQNEDAVRLLNEKLQDFSQAISTHSLKSKSQLEDYEKACARIKNNNGLTADDQRDAILGLEMLLGEKQKAHKTSYIKIGHYHFDMPFNDFANQLLAQSERLRIRNFN